MTQYKIKRTGTITDALGVRDLRANEYTTVKTTPRLEAWKAQGRYKSFNTGKPMLLELDEKTGATTLSPLYKNK